MEKIMTLRPAQIGDAPAISALIVDLMPYLTLEPDGAGADEFIASMQTDAIARYLAQDRYRYQLGFVGEALAGVVAVRDGSHLFHLFVARAFHGRGLARQLWQAVQDAGVSANADANADTNAGAGDDQGAPAWTVNSSPHAAAMYQHFGFRPAGPRVEQHGVAWIPMRYAVGLPEAAPD